MAKKSNKKDWKDGNDYPLFGYRVMPAIKEAMTEQLDAVLKIQKAALKDKLAKPIKKNDVFVKALKLGLETLKTQKLDGGKL